MSTTSQIQKSKDVGEDADSFKLGVNITNGGIVISDNLVSFALRLLEGVNRDMEKLNKAPPKEEKLEVEIKDREGYRNKLKKVESGVKVSASIETVSFSIVMRNESGEIAEFTLGSLSFLLKMGSDLSMSGIFKLSQLLMEDKRQSVFFRKVFHNRLTDTPLMLVKFLVDTKKDTMNVKVRISEFQMTPCLLYTSDAADE